MYKYFKWAGSGDSSISSWESNRLPDEKNSYVLKSSNSPPPNIVYNNARMKLIFSGDFLK